jgi:hypothetical protein
MVKTTNAARRLEKYLKGKRTLTGVSVSPWGCVAGVRDTTGNWTFHLLRNVTITYKRVTYDNKLGPIEWGKQKTPACVSQNLGQMQFFPARGVAHYRAFNTFQLT